MATIVRARRWLSNHGAEWRLLQGCASTNAAGHLVRLLAGVATSAAFRRPPQDRVRPHCCRRCAGSYQLTVWRTPDRRVPGVAWCG
eukprot:6069072-Lingulodinium_polyedra.AAC.1